MRLPPYFGAGNVAILLEMTARWRRERSPTNNLGDDRRGEDFDKPPTT